MNYLVTYIEPVGAYRIWSEEDPDQTVAYLTAEDLALVLLEDPSGHTIHDEEDTRKLMKAIRERKEREWLESLRSL